MAKSCLYCNLPLPDTADFCPQCGRPVERSFEIRSMQESEFGGFREEMKGNGGLLRQQGFYSDSTRTGKLENNKIPAGEQSPLVGISCGNSNGREASMSQLISNSWDIVESDFPVEGTTVEHIQFLLNYAVLAPSRHNVQPWLFKVEGNTVELYADQSRALPVADADNREMIMSCGAALANLLIAARHFGYAPIVELSRELNTRDMLARVSFEKGGIATEEEQKLFRAIIQRRTNCQLFKDRVVPVSLLSAFEGIAGREGTRFQIVQGEEARYAIASLIATGDHLLWADERFRQEIASWTRPADSQSRDGVPAYALGKGDMASYLGPLKIRTFMDNEETDGGHHLAVGSPVLAVLWTFTDTWFDWLAAGQALERILLYARAASVWASFFSQPIEIPTLRTNLRDMFGRTDYPQLALRMGYGPEVPPTPRRSVEDVLLQTIRK